MAVEESSGTDFVGPIMEAAVDIAQKLSAQAIIAYVNSLDDPEQLKNTIDPRCKLILVCQNEQEIQLAESISAEVLSVPAFDLTRMGQVKMATLIAFSQQLLKPDDVFVFLTGVVGCGIDTVMTMRVGKEYELFHSVGQPKLTEHIRRPVFERVLRIALELAHEGREGKPVGAIFVLGDHKDVNKYYAEGRINPFKGYAEKERNILDEMIDESVKEIAKLDGAFIIKGNGVIVEACAVIRAAMTGESQPQGWGARQIAAAAITGCTKSIAITLSQSTGAVRIWRRGALITEIERSARPLLDGAIPPTVT